MPNTNIAEEFAPKLELSSNGYSDRFNTENGGEILKKYFKNIKFKEYESKIIFKEAEPIVSYKASTIQGAQFLVGKQRERFKKYIEKYIEDNGNIEVSIKCGVFIVTKYKTAILQNTAKSDSCNSVIGGLSKLENKFPKVSSASLT